MLVLSGCRGIEWHIRIKLKIIIPLLSSFIVSISILAVVKKKNLCHIVCFPGNSFFHCTSRHTQRTKQPQLCLCSFVDTEKSFELYHSRTASNQQTQSPAAFTSLAKGSLPLICLWSECPDSFPVRLLLLFCPYTLLFPT